MNVPVITALAAGIASVVGAVTALVATWRHITGPAHRGVKRP